MCFDQIYLSKQRPIIIQVYMDVFTMNYYWNTVMTVNMALKANRRWTEHKNDDNVINNNNDNNNNKKYCKHTWITLCALQRMSIIHIHLLSKSKCYYTLNEHRLYKPPSKTKMLRQRIGVPKPTDEKKKNNRNEWKKERYIDVKRRKHRQQTT